MEQLKDWLWVASLGVGAFIAYQNVNISLAIERLRTELSNRIGKVEGDVKVLKATMPHSQRVNGVDLEE